MDEYSLIPEDTIESIDRWVQHGCPPGDFLLAVLTNDLRAACERADLRNRRVLFEIVSYLYNKCPSGCWGSSERVKHWVGMRNNG
jgi:hypothetical protein